ncbi:right-handed parallel beta-helix repeat-containing protein [Candidatus Woesearchaeota archaeon]|nr:right-handed parallel beta-helix repeat-containing protein [Candidatus Woesearchaeota archaeon]
MIKMKKILIVIVLLILLSALVSATNYYVAKDGSGDFTTIQAASNVAQPGDNIYIRAGTYREQIRPSRSGSSGNYITYARHGNEEVTITGVSDGISLNGRNYIVIDGLRIEDVGHFWIDLRGGTHNIIKNCYMRGADGWSGITLGGGSDYNKILDNTIVGYCGPSTPTYSSSDLIFCSGGCHNNLIEGNDIQNGAHVSISLQAKSGTTTHNVIRNNKVRNLWHTATNTHPNSDYTLIEGNTIVDAGEEFQNNMCGSDRDRTMNRNLHASIQLGASNCIVRNNVLINNGQLYINSYSPADALNNHIYHNTLYQNYYGTYTNGPRPVYGNVIKNNIFYNQREYELYVWINNAQKENYFVKNNILGADILVYPDGRMSLTQVQSRYPNNWYDNLAVNPGFVNAGTRDLHLQSGSPMINAGAWLTKTTSSGSSSRTLRVEDAGYFMDGWGIIEGDLIQLQGQTATARITNVNYGTNTLTISTSLSWSSGTGVALAYSGSAPDIGAYEHGGTTPPPPQTCSNCKLNPCSTYDNCISASGTCPTGMHCCTGSCTETTPETCPNCKLSPCNTYENCISTTGTCPTGMHCCTGSCTTTTPPTTGLEFEAEDGAITSPFIVSNDYIYQTSGTELPESGRASYTFSIDNAGDYIIKILVNARDGGSNSVFINIDAEPTSPYMICDMDLTSGFEERTISWRGDGTFDNNEFVPKVFTLSAGEHELILRGREGQTQIDKIIIESYGGGGLCIAGDMPVCNGIIDLFDLIFVINRFGTTPSDSNWDSAADIAEPKNIIDIFDVVFVASRMT